MKEQRFLTDLPDSEYQAHWLAYQQNLDWSKFKDMTSVPVDSLYRLAGRGDLVGNLRVLEYELWLKARKNQTRMVSVTLENTKFGGLHSAHVRRTAHKDTLLTDEQRLNFTRVAVVDNMHQLDSTFFNDFWEGVKIHFPKFKRPSVMGPGEPGNAVAVKTASRIG